ncbi:MAG: hypothetical protein NVV73_09715 [Cellvibrionaceae bacterium]|nr:hypothetical protein [Cellvibrionaceae bacterium]
MSDLHIDDFYRDAAKILATLYGQFPRKITLYAEDISGPDTPDEFGLHSPRHQSCFHTMMWLGSSDYLVYEQAVRQEALDQVVLSHRGFLVLSSAFHEAASLPREGALTIHRIRQELREGTSYSLAEAMQQIMLLSRNLGEIPRIR